MLLELPPGVWATDEIPASTIEDENTKTNRMNLHMNSLFRQVKHWHIWGCVQV